MALVVVEKLLWLDMHNGSHERLDLPFEKLSHPLLFIERL